MSNSARIKVASFVVAALLSILASAPAQACPSNGTPVNIVTGPTCGQYHDSGYMALKPWHTKSTDYNPSYTYHLGLYNHWTSGHPVTTASLTSPVFDSATYTNWGVSDTHYARTTDLGIQESCVAVVYAPPVCSPGLQYQGSPITLPCCQPQPAADRFIFAGATAAGRPRQLPGAAASIVVTGGRGPGSSPETVSAACPSDEVLVHAEGDFGTISSAPGALPAGANQPVPLLSTRGGAARATLGASDLKPGSRGVLSLSVICGERRHDQLLTPGPRQRGRPLVIGSSQDETLRAPAGGAIVYGGSGAATLIGGNGNDVLYAGSGNDSLSARGSSDVLIGGSGADTEMASPLTDARTMLVAGTGQNTLIAGPGLNYIDSWQGSGPNTIMCAGKTIVRARHEDHISGPCTRIIYGP